jgi:hypothetical protein
LLNPTPSHKKRKRKRRFIMPLTVTGKNKIATDFIATATKAQLLYIGTSDLVNLVHSVETLTWGTPSNGVVDITDEDFAIDAGEIVNAVVLLKSTSSGVSSGGSLATLLANTDVLYYHRFSSNYPFTNAGVFTLTSFEITVS